MPEMGKVLVALVILFAPLVQLRRVPRPVETHETMDVCGYESCPVGKPDLLNVHVVAHTHDDVGWLKTVDQYYYGYKNDIQRAGVQYILDNVVKSLLEDPSRKFSYVETAFFWRWWQEQSEETHNNVRMLVNQGRLTMINGAWSMNDEATVHYSSLIENFAWGLRRLNDTFGSCARPTTGWQIDPFGHAKQHSSLLTQMGYDGLFLGRVDYQDKDKRRKEKTLEMVWEASSSLGDSSDIFTGILPNGYSPPLGFCFDDLCANDPIMDDKRLFDYNVDAKVQSFIKEMESQAMVYASNHLIVTMGEDFNYQNSDMWFKNLEKLIKYTNAQQTNGSKVNLFYSTPACYLYALNQAKLSWPTKTDDFFPYANDYHSYWTGYFTSRPALKRFEREGSNFLNSCKQIVAVAGTIANQQENTAKLRESLGVMQHHDAVAGTEKQAVAFDYALRLDQGIKACQGAVSDGLSKLLNMSTPLGIQYCDLLNISQCEVMENNKKVAVVMWNALGHQVQQYVHIPVPDGSYTVTGAGGAQIPFQLTPLFKDVLQIPGRVSKATQELVFYVTVPATGLAVYGVYRTAKTDTKHRAKFMSYDDDVVFQNAYLSASFDVDSGILKSVTNVETGEVSKVNQTYQYYQGYAGNNSQEDFHASGAYIFRPNCTGLTATQCRLPVFGNGTYEVVQGPLVSELRQYFAPWISQVVRLYQNSRLLEFEWQIGPVPISDGVGKEVVSVFSSDLSSSGTVYTDSNGREVLQRKRNYRPTWDLNLTEPVSANYYPITNRIYLRDDVKGSQLTVLTDRAQGGGSIVDGQMELMIHRRLLYDDAKGVGEPLNEPGYGDGLIVRGKHCLSFSKTTAAANITRTAAQELYWKPALAFAPIEKGMMKNIHRATPSKKLSADPLPPNIHLLTFEAWTNSSLLIRLEHLFEKDEDPVLSQPVTVDLQQLLGHFKVVSVQEMTLDGNAVLSSIHRLNWKKKSAPKPAERGPLRGSSVTINPMEIRTFQVTISS